jgi:hypothetical protein
MNKMWLGIILFAVVLIYLIIYKLFFSNYIETKNIFNLLEKTLNTRNLLILKILPEIKYDADKEEIVSLIKGINEDSGGYTNKMYLDIKLNKLLKNLYEEINNMDNKVIKDIFGSIIELEKKLKIIRNEYNMAVNKYNENLVKHKYICMRVIKMKPLDTYNANKS